VVVSMAYTLVWRLFELVLLLARGERSKELEILVVRHELSILRRQTTRRPFMLTDRLLPAALSRVLPRRSWSAFVVRAGDAASLAAAARRSPLDVSRPKSSPSAGRRGGA
jgi:hypothetical protein